MKTLPLLFAIITTLLIGCPLYAEKFQIINYLPYPISYRVKTDRQGPTGHFTFQARLGSKKISPHFDIGHHKLLWIEWNDNGIRYIATFVNSLPYKGITLHPHKNKYFNIYSKGTYKHNLEGYKVTQEALLN
jgi:hypothetical protein